MTITRSLVSFACVCLLWAGSAIAQSEQPERSEKAPDVRVIIDISGSMKLNDPENLRRPALELLVRLFPKDAKAGVWTFGQWVNMLVKHEPVDEVWRQNALQAAQKINSVALYTNIPDALEKATDDIDTLDTTYDSHIILLTDGMVDVSKSNAENEAAREKIIKEILPKLRDAGFTIHTVALSKNADDELMKRLAVETGGLTAVANTAEDLTEIFLQAFDAAAPAEQVPLEGNSFIVDSSIEEFTALIFRKAGSGDATLVSPDQQSYTHNKHGSDISWHRADNYDLITVRSPFEGEWNLVADLEPNSRVTIVSNLSLIVNRLAASMFVGGDTEISALIEEQGKTLQKAEILNLINMQVGISRRDDGKQWQYSLSKRNPTPADGLFTGDLSMLQEAGVYDITVRADGKTFSRERKQTVAVRETLDVTQSSTDDAVPSHKVTLFAQNPNLDTEASKVLARVKRPDGSSALKAVKVIDERTWQLELKGVKQSGYYEVSFEATGQYTNGSQFDFSTEPVTVEHLVAGSAIKTPPPLIEEPVVEKTPEPEPIVEPEPTPEPAPEPEPETAEEPAAEEGFGLPDILMYAGIVLGNLLAIGLGYMAYKMVMGTGKSDILDDDDEVEVDDDAVDTEPDEEGDEPVAAPAPEPEPEPQADPEPSIDTMEDLDDMGAIDEDEDDGLGEALDLGEVEDLDTDLLDVSETEVTEIEDVGDDDLDLPDDAIDIDPDK